MGGTQNFAHGIYREKIPRYLFVVVVTSNQSKTHATIKLNMETCLIRP